MLSYAMVSNHVRAMYGVYFVQNSYDFTAPVRRQKAEAIVTYGVQTGVPQIGQAPGDLKGN